MKPLLAIAMSFLGLALPDAAAADPADSIMTRAMAQAHIPGAAIAIIRGGKIVKLKAYGTASTELGVPATVNTPFQIASSGKIYTAVLLMRMVELGEIALDDSVTRFVPDAPPAWRDITVRDLAAHLSGLASVDIGPDSVSTLDAVRQAFAARVVAPPGERASYDSFDYTLLQYILEKAGGDCYPALLRKLVLAPNAMACTGFDLAETRGPQRVAAQIPGRSEYYRWVDGANQRRWFMYSRLAYAAGGAYSCIADMARLFARLDSGALVSPKSKALLEAPATLRGGGTAGFSMGLVTGSYRGHRWIGHSGGPAFSDVMYFPDDHVAIAVFTNQQRLSPRIAALIADRYIAFHQAEPAAIADTAPTLTSDVRRLLEGAAIGNIDPQLFADASRQSYVDDLDDVGPVWMGLFGKLTRLVLLADRATDQGGRVREYRADYGDHPAPFTIRFDSGGRITGVASSD